jgi:hypothetical protein
METRENHVKFSISNYTGYLLFAGESRVLGTAVGRIQHTPTNNIHSNGSSKACDECPSD